VKNFANCKVLFIFTPSINKTMKILNRRLLDRFIDKHTDAESGLQRWVDIVEETEW